MPFDLGDTARLTADCTDAGGTLANAVTAVLTVTLPDGTTATPPVTNPPAVPGRYTADYTTSVPGRHAVRWVWTSPACAYTDVLDVRSAAPALLFSLADAKHQLSITSTAGDDDLRGWIESLTEGVEGMCGPMTVRTVAERCDLSPRGVPQVALVHTPAIALVSALAVFTGRPSYAVETLDLDGPTGIVVRKDRGMLRGPLRITYIAGRTQIPATVRSGGLIILQHLWRTKYGSSRGVAGVGGGDDYAVTQPVPGFGYAIPNRALEMLEPYRLPPAGG